MFYRTYTNTGAGPTGQTNPASLSGLRLDKYLVTVGRFRQFVAASSAGWTPTQESGKHAHISGGRGLANGGMPGTYEPGWITSDQNDVAPTNASLICDAAYATWTPSAAANENLPINCVNWYEAYAFCIWDGGFLPSEAEWEYASAGGRQEREYPWGVVDPGTSNAYAIYSSGTTCYYPTMATCTGATNIAPVGTATLGAGLWGQLDLAGELWQWTLDGDAPYAADNCADCANIAATAFRVIRGGSFDDSASFLVPSFRNNAGSTYRVKKIGLRCARSP
jgi:sulfatase modifying factor 1